MTPLKMKGGKPTIAQNRTGPCVEEEGEKDGVWGLPPEAFCMATPSRTSENALLEHGVKVLSSLMSFLRRKIYPLARRQKTKKIR